MVSHCHDAAGVRERHDRHEEHSQPCASTCCEDQHDHEALAGQFINAMPLQRLPSSTSQWVTLELPPLPSFFADKAAQTSLSHKRGLDPGVPLSCLSRRTVALLM